MPTNRISAEEVNARVLAGEPVIFLDARNPEAWKNSDQKIPHAIRFGSGEAAARSRDLNRAATFVAYCT